MKGPNVPRRALHARDLVLVVAGESELHFRTVEVVWSDARSAVLASGLDPGERVVVSPLALPIDGMRVRVVAGGTQED